MNCSTRSSSPRLRRRHHRTRRRRIRIGQSLVVRVRAAPPMCFDPTPSAMCKQPSDSPPGQGWCCPYAAAATASRASPPTTAASSSTSATSRPSKSSTTARHVVRIGGGATWGQVAAGLAPHSLAISAGDTNSVGVGGLTLSGGIGWKVRKYGLALDQVVAADMVIADGTVVHVSAHEHPELFWAIRGGGGNFGIVTAFEFTAHPTTDVFYGKIAFPSAEADRVLQGWADYLRSAPDDLTSVAILANPAAGGPEAPIEFHVVVDGDDAELAADALEPIRRLGTAIDDDVTRVPYADTLVDGATLPPGIRLVTRSAFVERDSVPEVLQILAMTAASNGSPAIAVRSVSGAVSRVPNDATAYPHRRAELMVATLTAGPDAAVTAAEPKLDAIWRDLATHVTGAYANFLTSATDADVAAIYPAETFSRLAAVKRQYDPGNVFARNHNIAPASSRSDGAHDSRSATRKPRPAARSSRRPVANVSAATRTPRHQSGSRHDSVMQSPDRDAVSITSTATPVDTCRPAGSNPLVPTSQSISKGAPHADNTAREDSTADDDPTVALGHRGDGGRAGAHHRRDARPVRHQRTARPHPDRLSRLHRRACRLRRRRLVDHLDRHRSARSRRVALVDLDRREGQALGELGGDRDVRARRQRCRRRPADHGQVR